MARAPRKPKPEAAAADEKSAQDAAIVQGEAPDATNTNTEPVPAANADGEPGQPDSDAPASIAAPADEPVIAGAFAETGETEGEVPAASPEVAKENEPAPDEPEELEGVEFVLISPVRMRGRREIGETVFLTRHEHLLLRKAGAVAEDWPEES